MGSEMCIRDSLTLIEHLKAGRIFAVELEHGDCLFSNGGVLEHRVASVKVTPEDINAFEIGLGLGLGFGFGLASTPHLKMPRRCERQPSIAVCWAWRLVMSIRNSGPNLNHNPNLTWRPARSIRSSGPRRGIRPWRGSTCKSESMASATTTPGMPFVARRGAVIRGKRAH